MSHSGRLPFYNPLDPTHAKVWPDYTLLMPVCAVGNIGQLACDLIISTLLSKRECQLVGRIYSPALMPVVGPNAYSPTHGTPTTSTEVYESKKNKLVIIQQRTTYFKNLKSIYIEELTNWIKQSKFDQLLVLTSSFAQCNPDTSQLGDYLNSCPVRSMTTSLFEHQDKLIQLGIKPIPNKRNLKVIQDGLTFLPGSGLTKPLVRACERAFIPAAFLVDFCSEGINIQDCYQVVNMVDCYLNLGCGASQTIDLSKLRLAQDTNSDEVAAGGGDDHHHHLAGTSSEDSKTVICNWVEPFSWTAQQY